jgi:hypothetical protein
MMKGRSGTFVIHSILFTAIFLISCGSSGSGGGTRQVSNTDFEESEPFSFDVPVAGHTAFDLQGESGVITITGVPGAASVRITGTKRVQSESTEDALAHLQVLNVDVQDVGNDVRVRTVQPQDTGGRNYIVDYTVTLPKHLKVGVINIGGIITLDAIDNDVVVINTGGNVTVTNIAGSALIALLSGTIDAEITLPLNGTIDLNTLTGDINLEIPASTSAQFSASVKIGNITVSNLVFQTLITNTSTALSGTLGAGQGTITLEADQVGDISVTGF